MIYLCQKTWKDWQNPVTPFQVLEGGLTIEASVDFTGGIPEMIDLSRVQSSNYKYLFDYMLKADANGAFMSCSLSVSIL